MKSPKFLNDPIVLAIMQRDFPEADVEDYQYYFSAINSVGCGYIAYINYIFSYYQERGKQDEFEKTFGFPMYTASIDGTVDYNYEYLLLDMFNYIWANKEWSIEELYGDVSLDAEDGALKYDGSNKVVSGTSSTDHNVLTDSNYSNYIMSNTEYAGTDKTPGVQKVIATPTTFNQWFFDRTGLAYDRKAIETDKNLVYDLEYQPGTPEWYEIVRNNKYLDEEQMLADGTPVYYKKKFTDLTIKEKEKWLSEQLEKGEVILGIGDFHMIEYDKLTYKEGTVTVPKGLSLENVEISGYSLKGYGKKTIGAHSVTLVETIDVGLVVSSWGQKYVIPWSEVEKIGTINIFSIEQ